MGSVPSSRTVGLLTGALIALGGTIAVLALGSYSRTLPVRSFALAAAWAAGLAGGFGASRASARHRSSDPGARLAAGIGTGLLVAFVTLLILTAIAMVIPVLVLESSGFNSY